ncbi:hypothetical protein [Methylobacterium gnaphalii]|uniref:Uncharacterized protein n=1 Tax=Methylobacterium gnaphalii TaxID=1010610 RepID=A0A512JQD0_9HYPH|nr:hypothetical protein [Methylobacterium gnaphalii]GEP12164.1 hypothetical protein MGN01_40090 [Methylobacterium gnaphalii]GJD71688.1 hypothetical protein MMMDOFMJ_4651 [Methylobacterium gnaphalii]GLS48834.1 hypothetical protein GCM10007885_16810 [Methylobacterium gnaphalii]
MPRWALTPLLIVLFAIPGAMAVVMAWPFVRHSSIPTELDADALGILTIALLVGMLVVMMILPVKRRV